MVGQEGTPSPRLAEINKFWDFIDLFALTLGKSLWTLVGVNREESKL